MTATASFMPPSDAFFRVLFVDDEQDVLDGIERALFSHDEEKWEFSFAVGGVAALEQLNDEQHDVVVTDMRMPDMDGAELLQRVAAEHPSILRIILSGHTDVSAAMRAMPVCHQFLSKPTEPKEVLGTIERSFQLRASIGNRKVRAAAGEVKCLPARPAIYDQVVQLLQDDDSSLAALADVIEQDIGISTKLLHVSNSAFFNRGNKVRTVGEAVTRVGPRVVRDVALSTAAFGSFKSVKAGVVDSLAAHSFKVATVARELVGGEREKELAFTAGLLHDVGRLILLWKYPQAVMEIHKLVEQGIEHCQAELAVMQVTHAELGAYLLSLWALPYQVVEGVLYHHAPGGETDSEIAWAVCAAGNAVSTLDPAGDEAAEDEVLMQEETYVRLYEKALIVAQSEDLLGVA